MNRRTLRIATRASQLAVWQANFVAELLRKSDPPLDVALVPVTTAGDRATSRPLSQLGGVGVFTREIQQALLDDRADVAVHSLKDLPTEPTDGVALAAVPDRAEPYDALVLPQGTEPIDLSGLALQARIGTGSLRRRAQILHWRPDLQWGDIRGNVETRLKKLDDGQFDAIILAEAGLTRLGLAGRISKRLAPPVMFPAVGQGALGIECRSEDAAVREILDRINSPSIFAAVSAERVILSRLGAGCHAPLGVQTVIHGSELELEAVVLSADGHRRLHAHGRGRVEDPLTLGARIAEDLLRQGAGPLTEAANQWGNPAVDEP